jgi:predicted secreted protein
MKNYFLVFLKEKGGVISHIRYRAFEKQCEVQLGTVPALPARTHAGAIILFLFFSGEGEGG